MDGENCDYALNYIIIGDSGVGKSNLLLSLKNEQFSSSHNQTIGVDYKSFNMKLNSKTYKLKIWDAAGAENFRNIVVNYYTKIACALIVYDIDNRESFENIENWIKEFKGRSPKKALMILIGNKLDLKDDRKVTEEEGKKFAKKKGMLFFETSAKTGKNVKEVFKKSVEFIAEKIDKNYYDLKDPNCGIFEPKFEYRIVSGDTSEKENKRPKKSSCLCCCK